MVRSRPSSSGSTTCMARSACESPRDDCCQASRAEPAGRAAARGAGGLQRRRRLVEPRREGGGVEDDAWAPQSRKRAPRRRRVAILEAADIERAHVEAFVHRAPAPGPRWGRDRRQADRRGRTRSPRAAGRAAPRRRARCTPCMRQRLGGAAVVRREPGEMRHELKRAGAYCPARHGRTSHRAGRASSPLTVESLASRRIGAAVARQQAQAECHSRGRHAPPPRRRSANSRGRRAGA